MRVWKRAVVLGLAGTGVWLSGCGWTARDQFMASRQVTVQSRPGDGSEIASTFKASPRAKAAGTEVASRFEREGR